MRISHQINLFGRRFELPQDCTCAKRFVCLQRRLLVKRSAGVHARRGVCITPLIRPTPYHTQALVLVYCSQIYCIHHDKQEISGFSIRPWILQLSKYLQQNREERGMSLLDKRSLLLGALYVRIEKTILYEQSWGTWVENFREARDRTVPIGCIRRRIYKRKCACE